MTAGDSKRQGSPLVREYILEVKVRVYPVGRRWATEDHLGRKRVHPTEALAHLYAEGCIAEWQEHIRRNP